MPFNLWSRSRRTVRSDKVLRGGAARREGAFGWIGFRENDEVSNSDAEDKHRMPTAGQRAVFKMGNSVEGCSGNGDCAEEGNCVSGREI
jgi:hypothetical protein